MCAPTRKSPSLCRAVAFPPNFVFSRRIHFCGAHASLQTTDSNSFELKTLTVVPAASKWMASRSTSSPLCQWPAMRGSSPVSRYFWHCRFALVVAQPMFRQSARQLSRPRFRVPEEGFAAACWPNTPKFIANLGMRLQVVAGRPILGSDNWLAHTTAPGVPADDRTFFGANDTPALT